MDQIRWGIIGCGDVTEIKSGPAFNKVPHSKLVAVMRRDAVKAADYAMRHEVPKWYDNADALINDPEVNAIYIATPPSTHEEFAIKAILAGKPVYLEKPMAMNSLAAANLAAVANREAIKIVVAHYRRGWPKFQKIKELLDQKTIGDTRLAKLEFFRRSLTPKDLEVPKTAWRVVPEISGGGLFHDIAPHQLDLMIYFFGDVIQVNGISINQEGAYSADDIVTGNILFSDSTLFSGSWCFNTNEKNERDGCEIIGSKGSLRFSIFGDQNVFLDVGSRSEVLDFPEHQHVQQPMIEKVVNYFLGTAENPCSADEGVKVMRLMDKITDQNRPQIQQI